MALTDNIVGCWSPSVRGSGLLLPDLSGRGRHGVLQGATGADWQSRPFGVGVNFDGTDNNIRLPNVLENAEQTVVAWILPRSFPSAYNTVICKDESATRYWTILVKSNGKMAYYVRANNDVFVDGTGAFTLAANTHYCVALSYSASRGLTGYVNAKIDGTAAGSGAPTTGSTLANIGSHSQALSGGTSGRFFDGVISEVVVWSRVLEHAEISDVYRRGNGAIGRELTGQTRRRVYGFVPAAFRAYWVRQKSQVIGGGV